MRAWPIVSAPMRLGNRGKPDLESACDVGPCAQWPPGASAPSMRKSVLRPSEPCPRLSVRAAYRACAGGQDERAQIGPGLVRRKLEANVRRWPPWWLQEVPELASCTENGPWFSFRLLRAGGVQSSEIPVPMARTDPREGCAPPPLAADPRDKHSYLRPPPPPRPYPQ